MGELVFAALRTPALAGASLLLLVRLAAASCGQAYCTVDTRVSEEKPIRTGEVRLDLSTEYIEQDSSWVGHHSVDTGAVPRPDHQEVETTNLTIKLAAEVAVAERWAISVMLPFVDREHLHLGPAAEEEHENPFPSRRSRYRPHHTSTGGDNVTIGDATGVPERWNFTAVGDLQTMVRFSLLQPAAAGEIGVDLLAGLKLPSGDTGVRNDQGELAEITLQPGTGSVDPLLGATVRGALFDVPVFAGTMLHLPGSDGRYGYRPGTEWVLNAGVAYPFNKRLDLLAQSNFRYRDRDHVGDAPGVPREHTGGEQWALSPGLRFKLWEGIALTSFVQVPVVQRVNGIQLVSRWNLWFGISAVFGGDSADVPAVPVPL